MHLDLYGEFPALPAEKFPIGRGEAAHGPDPTDGSFQWAHLAEKPQRYTADVTCNSGGVSDVFKKGM